MEFKMDNKNIQNTESLIASQKSLISSLGMAMTSTFLNSPEMLVESKNIELWGDFCNRVHYLYPAENYPCLVVAPRYTTSDINQVVKGILYDRLKQEFGDKFQFNKDDFLNLSLPSAKGKFFVYAYSDWPRYELLEVLNCKEMLEAHPLAKNILEEQKKCSAIQM